MLEAMSNFDFLDQNLQFNDKKKEVKLPKIDRPISKQQLSIEKSKTKFPSLKLDPSYHSNPTINQPSNNINTNSINKIDQEEDQFVAQVRKKLRQQHNLINLEGIYQSDDDFQDKINENKQIIKKYKQNIQNKIHSNNSIILSNKNKQQKQQLKLNTKNRNESLYEKRLKQYRDISSENKYLQKKKQIVINRIDTGNKQRQYKQSIIINKMTKINDRQKISIDSNNQQQLFDNIQNLLENPKKSFINIHSIKPQNPYQKPIKQLEDKIKEIDEKINSDKINNCCQKLVTYDTFSNNRLNNKISTLDIYHNASSNQWRKIELVQNKIQANHTTLDKEIQKINKYLEKGQKSLQKYVENYKILLDLQIRRKNKIKSISDNKLKLRTQD